MKRKIRIIVAARRMHMIGRREKSAVVKIGKPQKQKEGDWECPFYIEGIGMQKVLYGRGIDAIQALLMAFEGIRHTLDKSGRELSWAGGEPGETGFTRFVPTFYGLKFSKRLHRLIEQEVSRFAGTVEKRARKKKTSR